MCATLLIALARVSAKCNVETWKHDCVFRPRAETDDFRYVEHGNTFIFNRASTLAGDTS